MKSNATAPTPELLWERFLQEDAAAFTQLYERLYRPLYYYALGMLRHEDDAQHLLHDLFVHLWQHRATLRPVNSVHAYLAVAVRRRVFRFVKTKQRMPLESLEGQEHHAGFVFSSEDFLIADEISTEKKERVVQAINHLTERQREIIYLRYYSNLSLSEIAEVLNLNYQTVANHLQRAFTALRGDKALVTLELLHVWLPPLLWWFFC
ncbi:RNA polymerase sigma factor, sigma-70 family [Catalinimonas alkaloidigena]|uniref:RNA polymerase sigma factor, sigma-70 family n=1 Tax=Catalinimonas alkaloidigena TaxID=1075417 RepID=A0A1G8XIK1_9BACT|nr:sigma-70 family RNA polymerase sigma factor [Catalinimonas alkaloidigena]SDJ90361.1 RNA polymerase sigma factor, sigma-70 family [Catalinimonas alkaloidigena]